MTKNSELAKLFEIEAAKKFYELYPQMEINDIIPIYRAFVHRGPRIADEKLLTDFDLFMINNAEKYKDIESIMKKSDEEIGKVFLFFEGCLYLQKSENKAAVDLLDDIVKQFYNLRDKLTI